jgi:hypothetical protein
MKKMFQGATAFEGNGLKNWNAANVVYIGSLSDGASSMDEDLAGWSMGNVVNTGKMFRRAKSFQGTGLEFWDVHNILDATSMFQGAENMYRYADLDSMSKCIKRFLQPGFLGSWKDHLKPNLGSATDIFVFTNCSDQSHFTISKNEHYVISLCGRLGGVRL